MFNKAKNSIVWLITVGLALTAIPAEMEIVRRIGPNPNLRDDPWRSMVSSRNLLDLERTAPWAFPRPSKADDTDTIRVLAIRVEFQPDGTSRTTGDGTFDIRPYEQSPHPFDPLPHNKAYFESHMTALQNYYLAVSDTQLYVDFDVFPEADSTAYRLPDSMGYYGPRGWMGSDMADRLQQFYKDSWELAIASEDFDISDYDAYIIFHAGSDWQNDVGSIRPDLVSYWPDIFIPSPDDLPTGYLKLPFKIAGHIEDGIIMPEHAWQDGQIVCINGALAHEFGHQLGLVDLYNTGNFITQVGDFSLMDNGFGVGADIGFDANDDGTVSDDEFYPVYGMFPGYPDAWSRAYLGFETPLEVTEFCDSIMLQACEMPKNDGVTIIKIPINSYEYFLIENREYDISGDDGFYSLKSDSVTGVVLGALAVDTMRFTAALDYLLPGHGLLVWHIDETAAYDDVIGNGVNNFEDNTLQWDITRRFMALEEADGFEDLGTIVTFGEPGDYFYYGTNFGPTTNPSTAANDGGYTGILIDSMSNPGDGMHLRISFDEGVPTPDVITTIYPLYAPMQAADLDDDGIDELLTEAYYYESGGYIGCVLIWNADGTPYIDNGITVSGTEFDGSLLSVDYPVAATVNAGRVTLPAIGDIDGDELPDVIGLDTEGWLHAWNPRNIVGDYMTELSGFPVRIDTVGERAVGLWDVDRDGADEIIAFASEGWHLVDGDGGILSTGDARGSISGIAPFDDGLYLLASRNVAKLMLFDWTGEIKREVQLSSSDVSYLVRADLDGDGMPMELACAARSGKIFAFDSTLNSIGDFPVTVDDTSLASPIAADPDGDGVIELLISGRGGMFFYEPTGFAHENSPFDLENVLASPIFTGEYAIMPSGDGPVKALDGYGRTPPYFPLGGAPSNASPCLFHDENGEIGLALGSTNGSLLIWEGLESSMGEGAWPMWGADSRHTFLQPMSGDTPGGGSDSILSFYCYPNPAERSTVFRYELGGIGVADAKIDIFDAVGNRIAKLDVSGATGTPMEIEWITEKVGSGVYWARLTADLGGETTSKLFRVAVVK